MNNTTTNTKANLRTFYQLVTSQADKLYFGAANGEAFKYDALRQGILDSLFYFATGDYEVGEPTLEVGSDGRVSVIAGMRCHGMGGIIFYDGRDGRITTHT